MTEKSSYLHILLKRYSAPNNSIIKCTVHAIFGKFRLVKALILNLLVNIVGTKIDKQTPENLFHSFVLISLYFFKRALCMYAWIIRMLDAL